MLLSAEMGLNLLSEMQLPIEPRQRLKRFRTESYVDQASLSGLVFAVQTGTLEI